MANFFLPIGERINGVPLYLLMYMYKDMYSSQKGVNNIGSYRVIRV